MREKRTVVPEGMLQAAREATAGWDGYSRYHIARALGAALVWLSENPMIPTDEQAAEICQLWMGKIDSLGVAIALTQEWQRRMFLAPEPDPLSDLVMDENIKFTVSWQQINFRIREAYERGKKGI